MKYYLGADIGTTGTKTMLFDEFGKAVGRGYKEYPLSMPFEGAYEQNPMDWYSSLKESIKEAINGVDCKIEAISLSAQGGSFFLADIVDGEVIPLCDALTWLDARAQEEFEELKEKIAPEDVYKITGWKLSRGSAVSRLNWIRKHQPDLLKKAKIILSTSDYINYLLTGKLVIDYTSAAMMGMFCVEKCEWNETLMTLAGVNKSMLPKLVPTGEYLGEILPEVAKDLGINIGVKFYAGAHDQYAASLGANYFDSNDLLVATGTTWVIFGKSKERSFGDNFFAPCVHPMGGYGVITSAVSSGSVLSWEKDLFRTDYKEINCKAEEATPDENLLVYPFIAGNGNYRSGTHSYSVHNLALRHNSFDIIRASMEGVAFEIEKLVDLYTSCNISADKIILSGGATRSKIWMKILATILNRDLYISNQADRCCFGAYSIARRNDLGKFVQFDFDGEVISPDENLVNFYKKKKELYNKKFK